MKKQFGRIVIVGGGFAGVKLALSLAEHKHFEVCLISDTDYFEYHAALYRSATGGSPREVKIPLEDIFSKHSTVNVVKDKIIEIDYADKKVIGKSRRKYYFDKLVMAPGLVPCYFGIEGVEENAFSLDSIHSADRLRKHLGQLVKNKGQEKEIEFVVVGGGATGVELAAELPFYLKDLSSKKTTKKCQIKIDLIEASPRLLGLLSPKASKFAQWRLEELGVNLRLKTQVQAIKGGKLRLNTGESIRTKTVVWTAGATNNPIFSQYPDIFTLARNGRVQVDEYLRAHQDIYVIGDSADTQYSGMAQTALFDAKFLAGNLIRQSKGKHRKLYVPKRPVYLIPAGRNYAVLQWGRIVLRGKIAWTLRRLADLDIFMSFEPYRKAIRSWEAGSGYSSLGGKK